MPSSQIHFKLIELKINHRPRQVHDLVDGFEFITPCIQMADLWTLPLNSILWTHHLFSISSLNTHITRLLLDLL